MQEALRAGAIRRQEPGEPATRNVYAVVVETAPMGTAAFYRSRMVVAGRDTDEAQERAIAHVEQSGRCHRHVLTIERLRGS